MLQVAHITCNLLFAVHLRYLHTYVVQQRKGWPIRADQQLCIRTHRLRVRHRHLRFHRLHQARIQLVRRDTDNLHPLVHSFHTHDLWRLRLELWCLH